MLSALGYWQSKLVSEGKYSSLYDEYIQKEHGCEVGGGQTARSKPSKDSSISHPPSAPAPTPYLQPPTAKYDAFDNGDIEIDEATELTIDHFWGLFLILLFGCGLSYAVDLKEHNLKYLSIKAELASRR